MFTLILHEYVVGDSLCFAAWVSANTWRKKRVTIGLFAQNFAKDSSVVTVQYLLTRHCTALSGNHMHTILPGLARHHVQQYRTGLL